MFRSCTLALAVVSICGCDPRGAYVGKYVGRGNVAVDYGNVHDIQNPQLTFSL